MLLVRTKGIFYTNFCQEQNRCLLNKKDKIRFWACGLTTFIDSKTKPYVHTGTFQTGNKITYKRL